MVHVPFAGEEKETDAEGNDFRDGDRPPDAVKTEDKRQKKNGEHLKDERPKERDGGGHGAVAEGGEKRRGKNIDAAKQKNKGKNAEGMHRHVKQFPVVPDEKMRERMGEKFGGNRHHKPENYHQPEAFVKDIF